MATSGTVFEAMYRYYSGLSQRSMTLLRSLQEDIRTENLDYKRVMAQSLSLWFDATGGWWSALQTVGSPPVVGMFVDAVVGQVGAGELAVQVPGVSKATTTELMSLSGGRFRDPVKLEVTARRDAVEVTVLPHLTPPGVYQGYILANDKLLALLVIQVSAAPQEAPAARARAGRRRPARAKKR